MRFPILVSSLLLGAGSLLAQDRKVLAPVLQPYIDSHSVAGAVVVVAGKDAVLDVETVGFADIGKSQPMTADALFWIASMSKPITAAALMMLVDEGKVQLDDPVSKYIPEFGQVWVPVEKDATHLLLRHPQKPITVRQILSHMAGLGFRAAVEQPTLDLLPLNLRALAYASEPLQHEPGTKYQYANEGPNTAGRIIEIVSGMKYEDFLQQRLFGPLGMKDTTFYPTAAQVARLAKSYKPTEEKTNLEETTVTQLHYPLTDPQRQPMPAGGLFSTGADMAVFGQMLLNNGVWQGRRYLSEAAVAEMSRRQTPEGQPSYGLCFSVDPQGKSFGHGGAYATNLTIHRDTGLVTVYMVQHAGFANNGKEAEVAFSRAAAAAFGPKK